MPRHWAKLQSGLYVPPFIGRLVPKIPMMTFAPWYPCGCCGGEPCTHCSGTTPLQYQLDVSGVADEDCALCDETYDGQFILTQSGVGNCRWTYDFDSAACGGPLNDNYTLDIGAPVNKTTLGLSFGGVGIMVWNKVISPPIDCSSFQLLYSSRSQTECAGVGSTADLTAL
jgi:hypothetical protein